MNLLNRIPAFLLLPVVAHASPQGMTVIDGSASLTTSGNHLQITASHNAVLQWQSFNIAHGSTTTFIQPTPASFVWNHIHDANPSQIWGNLNANGIVVLVNPAGFHFGPDAIVNAAGIVVSTAQATPIESGGGLFWQFQGAPPQAAIINHGRIDTSTGGSLFLIANKIENHGSLSAPEGNINLLAGSDILLSSRPDGRGLSTSVHLPSGSIDNTGRIVADAGSIALGARVVNQDGLLQANTVHSRNGIIELTASDAVHLGAQSDIRATGTSSGSAPSSPSEIPSLPSNGGKVSIQSSGLFSDSATSRISVTGSGHEADGGTVAISAPHMSAIRSHIDARPGTGGVGGHLFIDPIDIVIGNTGTDSIGDGTVPSDSLPETLNLDVNSAFIGFSKIHLQASRNITIASGTIWDLATSTGVFDSDASLHLEAGNNITLANGSSLFAPANWSVTLEAGRNLATPSDLIPGTGTISLAGSAGIQAHSGDILLRAGNNITVASGFVRTIGGGDIHVHALQGNIQTGTRANGYRFLPTGYAVDADLGGISTANGGNVHLEAGRDITSFLPIAGGNQTSAGSGAFGAAPGNVTLIAGRDIAGHFVVRNGDGAIHAGNNAGTAARLLALSVINGGWSVHAATDILLQEVRNPNGIFNSLGSSASSTRHYFDYSASSYTHLYAGNSVQLRGTALPRYQDAFSQGMPPIYPGTLKIEAGPGGVVLGNDVILFPSPLGNLNITTTGGGSLVGTKSGDLAQLILSNSGRTQYRAFGDFGLADHAATPLHLESTEPVLLNISGDMSGILVGSPKRAEILVGGDMINSRFEGQNLRDTDITRIVVAGDIINRNEFTSVPMDTPPDFSAFEFNLIFPPLQGSLVGIETRFFYDANNKRLTFQGRMTGDELQLLLNAPVQVFNSSGQPVFHPNGEPVTQSTPILPAEIANQLYADSQDVPLNADTGYRIGGGGRFEVSAHNLDLGATAGIISQGPRRNASLAQLFTRGADIQVNLSGNLDMFSTAIASLNGGHIDVTADGHVNVGSRDFNAIDAAARGIFTVDPSNVTVTARGNINVNGSRIAGYDGGNVTVRSLEGNVDAGTGGSGSATVEKIHVDPITRQIFTYSPTIPGSGILATTFPPSLDAAFPISQNSVGNIIIDTPRGNIIASSGGVVQIPLNNVGNNIGTVTLTAGTRDEAGNVLFVGSIDASGSGVIGSSVSLDATGDIRGLVFARENIDLNAQQNVNVTALAQGNVNVGAGGSISGTIIGVGSVSASGASVDASLLSQNVSASGDVSSSQMGFSQGTAAAASSQSLQGDDQARSVAAQAKEEDDTRPSGAVAAAPRLTRTVGRVTVILPN